MTMLINHRLVQFLPWVMMLLLFGQALVPGHAPEQAEGIVWVFAMVSPSWQNLMHVICYGALCAAWLLALRAGRTRRAAVALALLLAVSFGALVELVQIFVPGRYGSMSDIILNAAGAGIAAILVLRWKGPGISGHREQDPRG